MTDRELMRKALENLEDIFGENREDVQIVKELRNRLAQTEPGPVAWELREGKTDRVLIEITNNPERVHNWRASLNEVVPLYTTPPQRPWVELTDDEIALIVAECASSAHRHDDFSFARAIEAALKERNHD